MKITSQRWLVGGFIGILFYFLIFFLAGLRVYVGSNVLNMKLVGGDMWALAKEYRGPGESTKSVPVKICIYWTGFGLTHLPRLDGSPCQAAFRAYPLF